MARFTGADRDFEGFACQAKGGTLVLDEFQSLPLEDQAKLLRFLGEREYRPLGSTGTKKCDAIIILASNQQLDKLVEAGSFRRDLLDRAPAKITLPPLYERKGDIAELAQKFAMEAGRDLEADEFLGLPVVQKPTSKRLSSKVAKSVFENFVKSYAMPSSLWLSMALAKRLRAINSNRASLSTLDCNRLSVTSSTKCKSSRNLTFWYLDLS